MNTYIVTEIRKVVIEYEVEAEDSDQATEMFYGGECGEKL